MVTWLMMVVTTQTAARAEPPRDADAWPVRTGGRLTVDGGLVLGLPATLGTGLSSGVGAGVAFGRDFTWGLRASWSSATESSLAWIVSQADWKLRATAAVQHAAGRGTFALRMGVGPTVVHETRVRSQGALAGLVGGALETSANHAFAAADLELVVAVHVWGAWLLTASGGPSALLADGALRGGWTSLVGTAWQP